MKCEKENTIIIGDTTHDHDVGEQLGIYSALVSFGHQNRETINKCNVPIFEDMIELKSFLLQNH